jgi:hypothetical protein
VISSCPFRDHVPEGPRSLNSSVYVELKYAIKNVFLFQPVSQCYQRKHDAAAASSAAGICGKISSFL